jgi:2-isopropylmalate synthase
LLSSEVTTGGNRTTVVAQLLIDGQHETVKGEGNGPIDAFVAALREQLGVVLEVTDYSEHALTAGTDASAVAYVEVESPEGERCWGVGMDSSILDASLGAVVSAANRVRRPPS